MSEKTVKLHITIDIQEEDARTDDEASALSLAKSVAPMIEVGGFTVADALARGGR